MVSDRRQEQNHQLEDREKQLEERKKLERALKDEMDKSLKDLELVSAQVGFTDMEIPDLKGPVEKRSCECDE